MSQSLRVWRIDRLEPHPRRSGVTIAVLRNPDGAVISTMCVNSGDREEDIIDGFINDGTLPSEAQVECHWSHRVVVRVKREHAGGLPIR